MKKAITLLLVSLLMLSLATVAMAEVSANISADAGIYLDLSDSKHAIDEDRINGFKGYHLWTDAFFYIDKPIDNNVFAGATIKLENSSAVSKAVFDVHPYVRWIYKPWTIIAGTHQGQKAGWSEDFDSSWWMVLENVKEPGVEINYEIMNGFNLTSVITSPEDSEKSIFNVLGKVVYDRNGFRFGGGYQSDKRVEKWGYWDVFTGFTIGEFIIDAEYQKREFRLSPTDYNYTRDGKYEGTSALLVNATYKSYPWTYKWRYWEAFEPGFKTNNNWHGDPERYYFEDIDNEYDLYDRVRKYGIESRLVSMDIEYKFSAKRKLNVLVYYALDLGAASDGQYNMSDFDKTSYVVKFEDKMNSKFTTTYAYKVLNEARQFNTKLEYTWAPGFRTNLEVGYGKTQEDVANNEDDGLMWIARMLVKFQ